MAANSGHRDPLASTDRFAPDTSRLTAPQPASRVERLLPRKETDSKRPNAASELRDLASRKQSRAHEEAGSSKWDYFSLMCK